MKEPLKQYSIILSSVTVFVANCACANVWMSTAGRAGRSWGPDPRSLARESKWPVYQNGPYISIIPEFMYKNF